MGTKVRISTQGRTVALDFDQQDVAEATFNKLAIMLFGIATESKQKAERVNAPAKKEVKVVKEVTQPEIIDDDPDEEEKEKVYKANGFLHIRCPECGEVKTFCSKKPIKGYHCTTCGANTLFTEPLKDMYVNCECGKFAKYSTNLKEEMFDINCVECGSPVAVQWNNNRGHYDSIKGDVDDE